MSVTAPKERGEITPNFRNNTNFPDGFDLSLLVQRKRAKETKNSSTVSNRTTKTCTTGAVEEVGNSRGSGQPVEKPRDKGEPPRQVVVLLLLFWLLKIENLRGSFDIFRYRRCPPPGTSPIKGILKRPSAIPARPAVEEIERDLPVVGPAGRTKGLWCMPTCKSPPPRMTSPPPRMTSNSR